MSGQEPKPSVADLAAGIADADARSVTRGQPPKSLAELRREARDAGCWFMPKPKNWGGGWTPVSWEGWLVSALTVLLAVLALVLLDRPAAFVAGVFILLSGLVIAEFKGRPKHSASKR